MNELGAIVDVDASKCYVCSHTEYDQLKQGLAKLVPVNLSYPIDPQLIFHAEHIDEAIGTSEDVVYDVSHAVENFLRRWQVTKATRLTSIEQWAVNALMNLEALKKRHTELPKCVYKKAFIVGNGPSVEEYIKHHKPEDVVISCWHASPKLTQAGIKPDLVVHMDKLTPEFGFTSPELNEDTHLVCLPTTHHSFISRYPNNPISVHCSESNILEQTVASIMGLNLEPQPLGTVVYLQALTAISMGYTELVFVGVDLKPTYYDDEETCERQYTVFADIFSILAQNNPSIKFKTITNYRPIEGIEYVSLSSYRSTEG